MISVNRNLPKLISVPAGSYRGREVAPFKLGKNPITIGQYDYHVKQRGDNRTAAMIRNPDDGEFHLLGHFKSISDVLGKGLSSFGNQWVGKKPLIIGALVLLKLRTDMAPEDFNDPDQPIVNVSWYHALEYCLSNGYRLPLDMEWSYVVRGKKFPREYGTSTGSLYKKEGEKKVKLAHFGNNPEDKTDRTIRVSDPRYKNGPMGFRHLTGNVRQWVDSVWDAVHDGEHATLRGVSWETVEPDHKQRTDQPTSYTGLDVGFRVAQDIK